MELKTGRGPLRSKQGDKQGVQASLLRGASPTRVSTACLRDCRPARRATQLPVDEAKDGEATCMARMRRHGLVRPTLQRTLQSVPTEARCGHALARSPARPVDCLGGSDQVATAQTSVERRCAPSASTTPQSCSFSKAAGGLDGSRAIPSGCFWSIPGAQHGPLGGAKGGGGRCRPDPALWVSGGSIARRAIAQPSNRPGWQILDAAGGERGWHRHRSHGGGCGSHGGRRRCRWQPYRFPN